ncbi:ABC transporter substrate-binding protein [Frondihabitans australicus]|uniref:Carbohydrate ABC transporter substrate-binding protein (CUT1 family) n=1 Tax=Frondihabitans australicus TaxID=386892 RepID=A0A495IED0_9MICO|nr:extracellular solute-binding protein [Frondihabitans australicus]RKR73366.1 carbohydrate ABC transporter substrate-binding protein (CUT1 family) [Frondihabitans australicus]
MARTAPRLRRSTVRAVALVTAAVATVALAGCTSSTSSSSTGSTTATPSGTLNIAVSSGDASDTAFKAINAAFEKKYPKVKINFSSIPNNNYPAAKSSRLTAGNVDILIAAPQELPSYVSKTSESDDDLAADNGVFLDLTNQSFMKDYTPSLLKSLAYKGKQYTVPTGVSYYTGVFYNKTMFAKNGWSIPTTWDQFTALSQKIQASGVSPLGIGGKDSWPAGLTMISAVQGLYPTQADKNTLAKDIWKKKTSLSSSSSQEILDRVKTMYSYAEPNFAGVSYAAVPAGFAAGKYAMTPDGTWDQPTIAAAVGSKFDYGYFPIPTSNTASDNATLGGKVDLRLAVASATKNKTAALAYLAFYSNPKNYATYVKLSGTAPAEPNIPSSSFLTGISKYTKTFSPAWDTIWVPNSKAGAAATFPFNYAGLSPLGSGSVSTAASASEKDWLAGF